MGRKLWLGLQDVLFTDTVSGQYQQLKYGGSEDHG